MHETPRQAGLYVRLQQSAPIPLDAKLHCAAGELLALVGPSGSGKTTILRAIAGLARPKSGHVSCNDAVWFDTARQINLSPQKRRVGLMFQDYALFPHLTALKNVSAALGHLPHTKRLIRARELLSMVHLSGLEERLPSRLSGGQRQRVALARALAREPAALLLDEPFSAVDQVTRRKLQGELVLLRHRIQAPTLLVTHDLHEAAALADRICAIHRGRTLQEGHPSEVMTRPCSALVARLMDLDNVFEGIVIKHDRESGTTMVRWLDRFLEASLAEGFAPDSPVSWVIPPSHIVLHRRGRPSRGDRENPVRGSVSELAVLGENTTVTISVTGHERHRLTFTVSTHAARRNGLAPGKELTISLLKEGIHVMPQGPSGADAL